MSDEIIQKMVMLMDMNGYEQDGSGPNFVNHNGGRNKVFFTWGEVYDFIKKGFRWRYVYYNSRHIVVDNVEWPQPLLTLDKLKYIWYNIHIKYYLSRILVISFVKND